MWFKTQQILAVEHLDALLALALAALQTESLPSRPIWIGQWNGDWGCVEFPEASPPVFRVVKQQPPPRDAVLAQFPEWSTVVAALSPKTAKLWDRWSELTEWIISETGVETPAWLVPQGDSGTTRPTLAQLRLAAKPIEFRPFLV